MQDNETTKQPRRKLAAVALAAAGLLTVGSSAAPASGVPTGGESRPASDTTGATEPGLDIQARVEAAQRADRSRRSTWVSPMTGARVTSCYGIRWGVLHAGLDLAIAPGAPIRAVGAGMVVSAGWSYAGYGISVLVDHGDGYLTHYSHLSRPAVRAGQRAAAGQIVGYEGATGQVTGSHLHFEVHKGGLWHQVEPVAWLRTRGVTIAGC